jgi:hypothetical protein
MPQPLIAHRSQRPRVRRRRAATITLTGCQNESQTAWRPTSVTAGEPETVGRATWIIADTGEDQPGTTYVSGRGEDDRVATADGGICEGRHLSGDPLHRSALWPSRGFPIVWAHSDRAARTGPATTPATRSTRLAAGPNRCAHDQGKALRPLSPASARHTCGHWWPRAQPIPTQDPAQMVHRWDSAS